MECLEQFIDNNSTTHDVQALNTLACCSVDGDLKLSSCPKHIGWVVEKHKHWENHFNLWWWWCASTAAAAGIPVQRHQTMNQHPCRVHHFLVADMLGEIGEVAVGYNNQSINLSLLLQKKILTQSTPSHPRQTAVCIPWNTPPAADWTHSSHTNARNAWWLWKRTLGKVQRIGCADRRWRGWCEWCLSSCSTADWFLTEDCRVKLWAFLLLRVCPVEKKKRYY